MAYVNVAEWTPEHVAEWLKGLEYSLLPYVHFFLNNEIDGNNLLNLTADDLEDLHIFKVGHQQLILEAVELLRQLHYNLTSETLQSLAVKLGCKARSLYNDLKLNGPQEHIQHVRQERVSTTVLAAVSEVLTSVKSLVSWLDRLPFQRDPLCIKLKKTVLKLSIELASTTQRDQFAERPHSLIKRNSLHLAELCDKFIQDSKDSLILQPASLDVAVIKKKTDEELGIHIKSTYSGVHIIGGIKDQSPSKKCNKIEKGDEIIQVNYQTVIGWQQKKLVTAMTEHSSELHLTIKKRPRHINILGEVIVLRPYRIPSKKTVNKCHKWSEDSHMRGQDTCSISNESECMRVLGICFIEVHKTHEIVLYRIPSKKTVNKCHKWSEDSHMRGQDTCSTSNESECMRDDFNDDEDDSAFLPADASASHVLLAKELSLHRRLSPGATPAAVQRRATVSGASPTVSKPPVNIEDLVNGVLRIKNGDTFGRSISHDPTCFKLSTKINADELDISKSDSLEKNVSPGTLNEDSKDSDENVTEISSVCCSETVSCSVLKDTCHDEKATLLGMEALSLQEECPLLENKSMSNSGGSDYCKESSTNISKHECLRNDLKHEVQSVEYISSCSKSSVSSLSGQRNDIPSDKHNIVLYNWEGADTAFCGRRPSAHDISNEIAGSNTSDINPVFLRKASKLPSSPPHAITSEDVSTKDNEPITSYQVVIVGGVPQKCPTSIKDGRDKSIQYRRKENSFKLGSRRISCKDLGKGDCEGFLYKQTEQKGFFPSGHQWVKRWIVLKNHFLYIFRDANDSKAECLISLPGSHVSQAFDCKTKKFAFKVSQQNLRTKFYFATESLDDLVKWVNKMGLAAIAYDANSDVTTSGFAKPSVYNITNNFYSETDDSESESPPPSRRENINELSTSSSSSEVSYDHYIKSDKKTKVLTHCNSKSSVTMSAYPRIRKQYQNNKDLVSNWIRRKTQTSSEVSQNINCMPELTSIETFVTPRKNFIETPNQKVSYNRSFSCTETSYCHFKSDPKNVMRKMSYEGSTSNDPSSCNFTIKTKYQGQVRNSLDEEYDILTSSLGRQPKPLAKEITPGLVARMAVSYSNLTQNNASSSTNQAKKINHRKGIPAPGYVAKISDSFDHLAKANTSNHFIDKKGKKLQHTSSGVTEIKSYIRHANCKRSASESQVSKRVAEENMATDSFNVTFSCESPASVMKKDNKESNSKKFVSLLDKEYNKVFEGKKVSQYQLKSHSRGNSNESDSSKREMRFFPNNDADLTGLSTCPKSNSIHSSKNLSKFASEAAKNTAAFRAWCVNADKAQEFPNELKKVQSFDLHNSKKSAITTSHSAHMYYSHLDSSEGIENIGFNCVDQISNDSFDSNFSNSSKDNDAALSKLSSNTLGSQVEHDTLTIPGDSSDVFSPRGTSFKFFNSPKFMKKLTSPKLDKKNIFKSKKQGKEKKAEQKEIANLQNDKKFFGSPRLVRAIFGSPKSQKKATVSSAVQTDQISLSDLTSEPKMPLHDFNRNDSFVTALDFPDDLSQYMESHEPETAISKSSSNSSLNSNISNTLSPFTSSLYYVEARIKPQITISLPLVTDKDVDCRASPPETPRTPLKPTMGVTMLSKKRLPSVSGESSVSVSSSKSSHDGSIKEATPLRAEVSMDINGDNELLQALECLQEVDIPSDTADISACTSEPTLSPNK